MRIEFEIAGVPQGSQKEYPTAYLEGTIKILIENTLFFNQPGILLIEFANSINQWLKKYESGDMAEFVYETMDHDEPLLSLTIVNGDRFKIDSIWKESQIAAILKKDEVLIAFKSYLAKLDDELKRRTGLSLKEFF